MRRNRPPYQNREGMPEEVTQGDPAPDRRRIRARRRPAVSGRVDPEHLIWAYQSHVTAIYQYLYSRVGNRADAEDLTSAVFTKAIGSMRSDVSTAELRAWLYRVAQTTLADHWREFYAEATRELEDDIQRERQAPANHEAVGRAETLLSTRARCPPCSGGAAWARRCRRGSLATGSSRRSPIR